MAAFGLNYMGTKRALAPHIASVVAAAKQGPLLDGFSGMCAVGQAVGSRRPVWSNDAQIFAATVAKALFLYPDHPPRCAAVPNLLFEDFQRNKNALENRLSSFINKETIALDNKSLGKLSAAIKACRNLYKLPTFVAELATLKRVPRTFPYRLFSYYYAGTYLGLAQCIEVDSIVYAIHSAIGRRSLTKGQAGWLFIALGMAVQRVATTTGHFAQYLELKSETANRYINQRTRSIWEEWLNAIPTESPVGDWIWRANNKVFRKDTLSLLRSFSREDLKPAVVYADPPYTTDHYSRYYHLLETLLQYDYPEIDAKARYRSRRFSTPFSIKSKVKQAFEQLAFGTANLGSDLIISYPKEGLLSELNLTPTQVIRPYFRKVEICRRITHEHSTHGASKGPASKPVTEIIYWARP